MARRKYPQPICDLCNHFMSWDDMFEAVVWTPYGGPTDIDPPDEEQAHGTCWNTTKPEARALITAIAWLGQYDSRKHQTLNQRDGWRARDRNLAHQREGSQ